MNSTVLFKYFISAKTYFHSLSHTMSELEALTKTLVQVVGSLQELISKKGAPSTSLEPEPKLKKNADMTYN